MEGNRRKRKLTKNKYSNVHRRSGSKVKHGRVCGRRKVNNKLKTNKTKIYMWKEKRK